MLKAMDDGELAEVLVKGDEYSTVLERHGQHLFVSWVPGQRGYGFGVYAFGKESGKGGLPDAGVEKNLHKV